MMVFRKSTVLPNIRARGLCLVALVLLLGGCGTCFAPDVQEPAPPPPSIRIQTPVAPLVQSPVSPTSQTPQTPTAPRPVAVPDTSPDVQEATEQVMSLTPQAISAIRTGMNYEEVQALLGGPGVSIAGTTAANTVYRWSDQGLTFMGRFESGQLTRTSTIGLEDELVESREQQMLQFDRDLYNMVDSGMQYNDIANLLGGEGQLLSRSDGFIIYKWTDEHGSNITGRFKDDVLVRKAGMIVESEPDDLDGVPSDDAPAMEEPFLPEAPEAEDDVPPTEIAYEAPETPAAEVPPVQPERTTTQEAPTQIRIAGASRRQREIAEDDSPHAGRSYRPRAQFPDYTRRLRKGVYEIRIHNTTTASLKAAVVSEEGGLAFTVGSNRSASAHVNQGTYRIYFIYNDDPYTLYQGQQIPVYEMLADFEVYITGESYSVHILDRYTEPSYPRRD